MHVDLLRTLLVFHADFIEVFRPATLAGTRFDTALCFLVGQFVRGHFHRVVDAAGDDRIVRVATEKINNNFLTDPRNVNHAPCFTRPRCTHSKPAATVFIFLAVAIPIKLNFDTTIFVGINLLAGGPNDKRRLWPVSARLRR